MMREWNDTPLPIYYFVERLGPALGWVDNEGEGTGGASHLARRYDG
jgi:hypothetical protein